MSIDVNVTNDLVIVTESSEDISVNVSNAQGPAGQGVPIGGTAGQVLKKLSNTNYDTFWTLDGVGVPYTGATGDVNLGAFNLTATSIIKSGGTSSQFLKADGSVDSSTYQPLLTNPVTGTGASGQVAYWNGTSSQTGSNNLFYDAANARLGIGTNTPSQKLQVVGSAYATSHLRFDEQLRDNRDNGIIQQSLSSVITNRILTIGNATYLNINFPNGNILLGTTTDSGQRLQVQGDAFIKGSGATSATTALTVQNSAGTDLFIINNSGYYKLSGSNGLFFSMFTTSQGASSINGTNTQFYNYTTTQAATYGAFSFHGDNFSQTSGSVHTLFVSKGFYPTSGTATQSSVTIAPAINQTGGANGITRGLYVTPTIVAAADWRSIEWSNNSGWGLYGAGTANNYLAGKLVIGTTSVGTHALDVVGTTQISGNTFVSAGNLSIFTTNTPRRINLEVANGSKAAAIGIQTLGVIHSVIGVDTSGNDFLQVASKTGISFYSGSTIGNIVTDPTNERMRLTTAGRLLLGTTTESTFLLDVNGTARVTGAATFSSSVTASSFIKSGGTSSQYLMADGSVTTGGGGGVDELQVSLICQVFG